MTTSASHEHPRWRVVYAVIVVAVAFVIAFSYGFLFLFSIQMTYLVGALVASDPTLLPNDWYARQAVDYHHTFTLLAGHLLPYGAPPFLVLETLLTVAGVVAVGAIVDSAAGGRSAVALPAFLLWTALALVTLTNDVMGSYVFAGYLQPSSFGVCGLLWAFAFHLRRRWWASGIALALGGLLHVNVLVVGIAGLGLAHVALSVRTGLAPRALAIDFVQRCLRQLGPALLVFLWAIPLFIAAATGPTKDATHILVDIRAPHHFRPTWELMKPFLAWQAACVVVVVGAWRSRAPAAAPLVQLWCGVGGFVVACVPLVLVAHVEPVVRVFPWRMAPEATLIAEVAVAVVAVAAAYAKDVRAVAAALVAFGIAAYGAADDVRIIIGAAAVVVVVVAVVSIAAVRVAVVVAAVAGVAVSGFAAKRRYAAASFHVPDPVPPKMRGLLRFAATTPKDALFAIPPMMGSFRMLAQRSVVVDWKSAGMLPQDLVEWYARLTAFAGRPPRSRRDVGRSWDHITPARA